MNVGTNLFQSTTESCVITALSNTVALLFQMVFHIVLLPSHIFIALIHSGLPTKGIYADLLPFVGLVPTVIYKDYGAINFKLRVYALGAPQNQNMQVLAKMVNAGECFLFGLYDNKTIQDAQKQSNNNNNNKNNKNNNTDNKESKESTQIPIQQILNMIDIDGRHAVGIQRIRLGFARKWVAFVAESDHHDHQYSDMNIDLFTKLFLAEISDFKIHRSIAADIYNEENWINDERKSIIWPGIFTICSNDWFQCFLYALMSYKPNYHHFNKILFSGDAANDDAMIKWKKYISERSLFAHNIFIKCDAGMTRTLLLILAGLCWINKNLTDIDSYKKIQQNIYGKSLQKLNDGTGHCIPDEFTKCVSRKYSEYGGYHAQEKKIKNTKAISIRAARQYSHCMETRRIFCQYIWKIFVKIGFLYHRGTKYGLCVFHGQSADWISDIERIDLVIPGWKDLVHEFKQKIQILDNKAFKHKTTALVDHQLFEQETKQFDKDKSNCYIPSDIKLPLIQITKPTKELKELLINKQFIQGRTLFDLQHIPSEKKQQKSKRRGRQKRKKWDDDNDENDNDENDNDIYYQQFTKMYKKPIIGKRRKTVFVMKIKNKYGEIVTKLL